jgi:hypothetical protein
MKAKKVLLLRGEARVVPLRGPCCIWTTVSDGAARVLASRTDKIAATQHFMSLKHVISDTSTLSENTKAKVSIRPTSTRENREITKVENLPLQKSV